MEVFEKNPKLSAPESEWNGLCNDNPDMFSQLVEETLNSAHSIRFRAPGGSMYPTICNGDLITAQPIKPSDVIAGDIILYRHKYGVVAHRVINIKRAQSRSLSPQPSFTLRGDAAINDDFPVCADQILGKVVSIERNGRRLDPYSLRIKLHYIARRFVSSLRRFLSSKIQTP